MMSTISRWLRHHTTNAWRSSTIAAVGVGLLGVYIAHRLLNRFQKYRRGAKYSARREWLPSREAVHGSSSVNSLRIRALVVYPVKSCAPIRVDRACVGPRGLVNDRRWMIVQAETGCFVTQREVPGLCLVQPQLGTDNNHLILSAQPIMDVPLQIRALPSVDARDAMLGGNYATCLRPVRIWDHECLAIDEGETAAQWITEFIHRWKCLKKHGKYEEFDATLSRTLPEQYRLVRMDDTWMRPVEQNDDSHTGFADGFPFLVCTQESLRDLNVRARQHNKDTAKLSMRRFRPNIVIEGAPCPYSEDTWASIIIRPSGLELNLCKPCERCVTTLVDPSTSKLGLEPLRTLRNYRTRIEFDPTSNGIVQRSLFGQNAVHNVPIEFRVPEKCIDTFCTISVNDVVEVIHFKSEWRLEAE